MVVYFNENEDVVIELNHEEYGVIYESAKILEKEMYEIVHQNLEEMLRVGRLFVAANNQAANRNTEPAKGDETFVVDGVGRGGDNGEVV